MSEDPHPRPIEQAWIGMGPEPIAEVRRVLMVQRSRIALQFPPHGSDRDTALAGLDEAIFRLGRMLRDNQQPQPKRPSAVEAEKDWYDEVVGYHGPAL